MAILKVARMGHPVLRERARPIHPSEIKTPKVQQLIDDMFETMKEYQGVGLAAPQIHEKLRVFVVGLPSTQYWRTVWDQIANEVSREFPDVKSIKTARPIALPAARNTV